jgi:hypothetical protein
VVALDVGHGQLDWKIRQDPRVEVREKVNARYLAATDFEASFDLIVIDVSFISLTKILPVASFAGETAGTDHRSRETAVLRSVETRWARAVIVRDAGRAGESRRARSSHSPRARA